ncbi:MAG TPA: DNA replication/repair protein RecF [Caulobacteraceae bacterium]|nr:DNA replication/repair protein RecF [Caulobacteraceae bacterium]
MTVSTLQSIALTDFRSYERAQLEAGGRSVVLFGPNGAGKTNVLEAISFLAPGRGLRGAAIAEVGRRLPGEAHGRPWAVSVLVQTVDGEVRLGSGTDVPGAARRLVRIDGEPAAPGRLTALVRPIWLTPAQDRLFLDGAGDRRRFFDRLTFAAEPQHAEVASAYEKATRERMRLLQDGPADPAWLTALEAQMAQAGAALVAARLRTLHALQEEIDSRGDRPFPQAALTLSGDWETLAVQGVAPSDIEARLTLALARGRERDQAAGRSLIGPHRGDLLVVHRLKDRPAAECSTGEQKALILNLVLAQAARLSRTESAPNPILLLDEVAAHLDALRRAALFDEITALGLQAFLTGADEALFVDLKGRAMAVSVDAGRMTTLED